MTYKQMGEHSVRALRSQALAYYNVVVQASVYLPLPTSSFSVWLDTEDITAGCDWHAAIGTGLDKCQALIAVISNKYIMSRYCKSELYTANGDQKHIFPVIVENVDFSGTERARGVKYVVSGINWTMFRPGYDDYQTSLTKLITGMKEHGQFVCVVVLIVYNCLPHLKCCHDDRKWCLLVAMQAGK